MHGKNLIKGSLMPSESRTPSGPVCSWGSRGGPGWRGRNTGGGGARRSDRARLSSLTERGRLREREPQVGMKAVSSPLLSSPPSQHQTGHGKTQRECRAGINIESFLPRRKTNSIRVASSASVICGLRPWCGSIIKSIKDFIQEHFISTNFSSRNFFNSFLRISQLVKVKN